MSLQSKLYTFLEEPQSSKISFYFNIFIYSLIIISILNLMLSTVASYQKNYGVLFETIRNIIMPIFIIEYFLRFYAAGHLKVYKGFQGRLKYFFSFYALVDLLSILPYVLINVGFTSSFIRSLRLLRIFRLFRAKKYAVFIKLMQNIMFNIKEELIVLAFFTAIILLLLAFSVFEIEHEAQPKVFTNIFQTLWWAVATLTTVGYGDMYPVTSLGKFITGTISIIGIAFVAIPGGMFASEFIAQISNKKEKLTVDNKENCPECNSQNFIRMEKPFFELDGKVLMMKSVDICQDCKYVKVFTH
jgi:voltage-gated potassium channel